jgi:hypothetical protein
VAAKPDGELEMDVVFCPADRSAGDAHRFRTHPNSRVESDALTLQSFHRAAQKRFHPAPSGPLSREGRQSKTQPITARLMSIVFARMIRGEGARRYRYRLYIAPNDPFVES